jgi:uncharacterized membrane protein YgcG
MNKKYFVYALFVTIVTTFACWGSLIKTASGSGGSSWSSHSSGSGGYGGGYSGGGGHK